MDDEMDDEILCNGFGEKVDKKKKRERVRVE